MHNEKFYYLGLIRTDCDNLSVFLSFKEERCKRYMDKNMMPIATKPHYELLDGLRGVAALLVVWYHVFEGFQFAGNQPFIRFINHGYLAVDFFFMLSGFVMGYAYGDRLDKSLSIAAFFKRRLIRLHPMVIMGSLIGFISFALTGFERWDGTHTTLAVSLIALVAAWLMIPALPGMPREVRGNGELFPLNGPSWSLFFEYIGNILYAVFIHRLSTWLLALLTALLSCVWAWFAITNQSQYGSIGVGWTFDMVNMLGGSLRMLCPFTIGILLSRVFKPHFIKGIFWWCSVILLLLFHVPFLRSDGSFSLNGIYEMVCILILFPCIVWLGASGKTTDKRSERICLWLGQISYSLYIVHYPLMYAFYLWLIKTKQYTLSSTWPVALCVILGSIILAQVCLKCYDLPVRKWLNKQ